MHGQSQSPDHSFPVSSLYRTSYAPAVPVTGAECQGNLVSLDVPICRVFSYSQLSHNALLCAFIHFCTHKVIPQCTVVYRLLYISHVEHLVKAKPPAWIPIPFPSVQPDAECIP